MTVAAEIQDRIAQALERAELPGNAPIVKWRKRTLESDLQAALAAQTGLAIYVPMPRATSAVQGCWHAVIFDGFEIRVQIVEIPSLNSGSADLWDYIEAVAKALHGQPKDANSPLAGIFAQPLHIARQPLDYAEGIAAVPGFEHNGESVRGADVIFNAVLELPQPA